MKKNFKTTSIIVLFFWVNCAEFEKPLQIDLFSPPIVRMIIGGIEESDSFNFNKQSPLHNNFQVRYQGKACRTDQNGSFYFEKTPEPITNPLYALISNGCYWTTKKEIYKNNSFNIPTLKQDESKPYAFYVTKINNGVLSFEKQNELLQNFNFEVPSDQTIILNINPKFVEEKINPVSNFLHHSSFLVLPHFKLKDIAKIHEIKCESLEKRSDKDDLYYFQKRLNSKNSLRKIKAGRIHKKETDIYQRSTELNFNNKRKKTVLMNIIKN